jgi:hypothetical protein
MRNDFLDILVHYAPAGQFEKLVPAAHELTALTGQLAAVLSRVEDTALRQLLLDQFARSICASLAGSVSLPPAGPPPCLNQQLTPELREWVLQQTSEEEILEGLREIRATGGLEFRDFLDELEQAARDE